MSGIDEVLHRRKSTHSITDKINFQIYVEN